MDSEWAIFHSAKSLTYIPVAYLHQHISRGRIWKYVSWKPPEKGWTKLNTDGATEGNPGLACAGGLIWDDFGRRGGFVHNIGVATAINAELWTVRSGLDLTWDLGFRRVVLEVDSEVIF